MQAGGAPAAGDDPAATRASGGGGGAPAAGDAPAAADHAQATHVFIKRVGDGALPDEQFCLLDCAGASSVGQLRGSACAAFGWGVSSRARMHLMRRPAGDAEMDRD